MTQPQGNLGFRRFTYEHGYMLSGECSRRENTGTIDVQPVTPDLIPIPNLYCTECGTQPSFTTVDDSSLNIGS